MVVGGVVAETSALDVSLVSAPGFSRASRLHFKEQVSRGGGYLSQSPQSSKLFFSALLEAF